MSAATEALRTRALRIEDELEEARRAATTARQHEAQVQRELERAVTARKGREDTAEALARDLREIRSAISTLEGKRPIVDRPQA
jgi:F0F1-type ATP synthase membrane subunit b/b'